MKYKHRIEHSVGYSESDKEIKLNIVNALRIVEDTNTEFFGIIKSDNVINKTKYNSVWVITKTKMHFNKFPKWRDKFFQECYIVQSKAIRMCIENVSRDEEGNVLYTVQQENCPIDIKNRKIRKISTISYPNDVEEMEKIDKKPFSKLNTVFSEEDKAYEQKVLATDIDYSNHTNNVMYVRFLINAFPSDYWIDKQIEDLEIHYIKETREGAILSIYKKEIEDGQVEFLIKDKDCEVIRAKIAFQ